MQLDSAERGFSFRLDGPLDMRMGGEGAERRRRRRRGQRARSRQHHLPARRGAPFARASPAPSSRRAREAPIATTAALADIVGSVVRAQPGDIHPATRTFQALRIFVNDELGELARGARGRRAHPQAGRPAGRGVVPFARRPHRQDVPRRRAARPAAARAIAPEVEARGADLRACSPSGRSVADDAEIARNPRARSAKLRAAERTDAPRARRRSADLLPRLPSLADVHEGALSHAPPQHLRHRRADPGGGARLQDQVRIRRCRPSASPSCAANLRRERDAIAALRAEWAKLDTPGAHPGPGASAI